MSNIELLPCPFCGHSTPEFERLGTGKQSCIVACGNCGCRHESGDEWDDCGKSWNTRAIESQSAQIAALTAERDALRGLADSEGSRAVAYLRRARKAEVDAKRYRYLRCVDSFAEWNRLGHYAADALDATVDRALAARASLNPTTTRSEP